MLPMTVLGWFRGGGGRGEQSHQVSEVWRVLHILYKLLESVLGGVNTRVFRVVLSTSSTRILGIAMYDRHSLPNI